MKKQFHPKQYSLTQQWRELKRQLALLFYLAAAQLSILIEKQLFYIMNHLQERYDLGGTSDMPEEADEK